MPWKWHTSSLKSRHRFRGSRNRRDGRATVTIPPGCLPSWLARKGRVVGFDIQESAIAGVRERLSDRAQVELHHMPVTKSCPATSPRLAHGCGDVQPRLSSRWRQVHHHPAGNHNCSPRINCAGLLKKRGGLITDCAICRARRRGAGEAAAVEKWAVGS